MTAPVERSCVVCGPDRPARAHLATCEPCERHVATQARAVAGLFGRLDPMPGAGESATDAPRAPGFASSSPARDDVLALTDPRGSDSALAYLAPWRDEAAADGVPAAVGAPRTVPGVAEFLASWPGLDWTSRRPDAGGLVKALDRLTARLEAAVGDAEPTAPVGACPRQVEVRDPAGATAHRPCGGVIRAAVYGGLAECRRCGAQWQGQAAWRELGRSLGDAELDAAGLARYLSVPVGTVRRWAHEDGWQRRQAGRRVMFSLTEARASYAARHAQAPPVSV